MQLALVLDDSAARSLQDQVFDQIREMILGARLRSGAPMPGSRALAEHLGVSRNTVTIAYEKLFAEGYLEVRPNIGTFVARDLPEASLVRPRPHPLPAPATGAEGSGGAASEVPAGQAGGTLLGRLASAAGFAVQAIEHPAARRLAVDFWVGRVDRRGFPANEWRRLLDAKLRHGMPVQLRYGAPQGDERLRRAIADHLGLARGIACSAEEVVVVSGSQDGLMLLAQALRGHCRTLVHETPCYQGARYLFQRLGFATHAVSVDRDGLQVEALPEIRNAVAFVTPSHQFPTGVTLSLPRRLKLLDWAERTDSLIVEDDYDGDFRYEGGPFTALRGLDRGGRVLYLGTFSRSMGPGLRLGYLVGSPQTAPLLARWKHLFSNGTPWAVQAAMAEFLDSGGFQRHLRRIRTLYRQRRDALIGAIERHFPGSEIYGRRGGMHISWRLPPAAGPQDGQAGSQDGTPAHASPAHASPAHASARRLQRLALMRGIGIYTVEDGGACMDGSESAHRDLLMLGYAALEEAEIARAIATLAQLDRQG